MISTKDLSGLPNAERLKNFCKGLAALDTVSYTHLDVYKRQAGRGGHKAAGYRTTELLFPFDVGESLA